MNQTSHFDKFKTSNLSPMLTSFYKSNAFANPMITKNITLKKHITQSEERPEANYVSMMRAYKEEKKQEKLDNLLKQKKAAEDAIK